MDHSDSPPILTRIVEVFLRGDVAIMLIVLSLMLGAASLVLTPREEEPQIVVPMADVMINAPGLSAGETERQVTDRIEKLLYQIDGVEYVYSMSRPGSSIVTVRFYVGEDREDSLVKLYNKINSSTDLIPPAVDSWVIKPIEVDDVPIVIATLWSKQTDRYGDHELRRIAEELQHQLQAIPNTNRVEVLGGRPRRINVRLDAQRMAAHQTSPLQIARALQQGNVTRRNGNFEQQNESFNVETGTFFRDVTDLENIVVGVNGGRPVYLKNVAEVIDGPAEAENYSWIGFGPADETAQLSLDVRDHDSESASPRSLAETFPAVHISVAKRKGTNAVNVAHAVDERMQQLARSHLPTGVEYRITRDYGETANDKVNELVEGLVVAVLTVIGLIGLTMGWRPALVIALAIPVCYSLTLFVNLMVGYSINRVTMFALILSLGLLVDDPITDVENIARYFAMKILPPRQSVLNAVQEVRPALLLSTLAIIASFLPLAFITGMMGPYMAPMALNVPLTVSISTLVAFVITPWLAMVSLKQINNSHNSDDTSQSTESDHADGYDITKMPLYRISRWILTPILRGRLMAWGVLAGVGILLAAAMLLPLMRMVPVKMLPYDNKNEFQVVIDMPENATLERTDAVARRIGVYLGGLSEVKDYEIFVGMGSPIDFNGLVRHYFLRSGSNVADIRVNLVDKDHRTQQSHELILRIRNDIARLAESMDANVKLVEVPPGPPVLASITAEIYGPPDAKYDEQIRVARRVQQRMALEPGLVDLDVSAEDDQTRYIFETDKPKAALSGISTQTIADTVAAALSGDRTTVLHLPDEVEPLWVELRLPRHERSALDELEEIYVQGENGQIVQLGSLGTFRKAIEDKTIYHKNLQRVVYVYAEVSGRPPADAIMDIEFDRLIAARADDSVHASDETANSPRPLKDRTWLSMGGNVAWSVPEGYSVVWSGEGEWDITLDVFRDLGIAFGAALLGIFVILMFQTGSRLLPVLIMLAIPLTMIGIMPGFWLLNVFTDKPIGGHPNPVFFTATAMIGMIALAGIVVRNSVVLIDFIHLAQSEGHGLRESIIRSVAVRTRPILLTAGTTLLANWVITLDPVFSGLAWAIIFGILTSTGFTLVVIPAAYWLLYHEQTSSADNAN
ncbi:efflux RND transporter permease subunit [Rhodopirellula sallentina]|uniref:Transporter, AcrB/D/F family n=1 Tax=Rhodopirellula sallentina SM41 TaxID=1263870 RepID=M5TTI8_9BACT|nr:efflux RND transporter permease subunit [Rhodopirellula sallentina]EMI52507.1 transporter, AcrB/D/F family [Rhodopirellula sallentina SM41]